MSEQAMSDERLAEIREIHRQLSYLGKGHALGELLAEVDRLRTENAELEAADDGASEMLGEGVRRRVSLRLRGCRGAVAPVAGGASWCSRRPHMKIHFAAQRIYDDLDYSGEEWLATPIRYQWFDFETERYYEISRDHRGDWELTTWLRSQRIYDANPYCRRLVRCCGGGRSQLRGGCSSVWRGSAAWLS